MLSLNIDEENGIIMLEPKEALSKADFESAARIIDPYLEHNDNFIGLVVHAKSFPGWDSFAALISHQDLKKAKSWIVQGSGKNPAK